MKVTFPYMGTTEVYARLFELLGHEVIMPPRPTRKTIELGVKYSPEFACFPLKVIMGTYLEALALGAETIITTGGNGPCRAGYYGEVHKKTLENMGYQVDFIIFDEPKRDWRYFLHSLQKARGDSSWGELLQAVVTAYYMAASLDMVEKIVEKKRAYIRKPVELNRLLQKIKADYRKIRNRQDISEVEERAVKCLNELEYRELPAAERVRIGIVGEIYVVMEGAVNNNLEEVLNAFGAEVERSHYISDWIEETLLPWKNKKAGSILRKAEPYIEIYIGGHAKQTVGHIIDYRDRGFDGVVHLKPFGCLPEIITQSMLDNLSERLNLPILSLSIDEQTAEANLLTRIEAFLDLVKKKRAAAG